MQRLIDANAFKKENERLLHCDFPYLSETTLEELIDEAPTIDTEPHWIPCSERLPKDDRSKVVTLANGNTEVGYYSNGDWWCIGESFRLENPTVIAWMPLPKPYEGDKE